MAWDDDKTVDGSTLTATEWNNQTADQKDRSTVENGVGAPSSTPSMIGSIYIDTTNNQLYFAKGTASSADWISADTEFPSGTQGDIIYYNGTAWVVLTAGTDGYYLKAQGAGADPTWASVTDVGFADPMTTRGDIIIKDATNTTERLALGTVGQLLTSDGTDVAWADAPVSVSVTTKGDVQTYDTAPARLAIGTDGQVLTADSAEVTGIKWADATGGGSSADNVTEYVNRGYLGDLDTSTDLLYYVIQDTGTVQSITVSLGTLPVGQSFKLDVRKNGITTAHSIFTADTPVEILTTETSVNGIYTATGNIDAASVAVGDVLHFFITQVGTGPTGADLNLNIRLTYSTVVTQIIKRELAGNVFATTLLFSRVDQAGTITEARASLDGLPIGADFEVNVYKNGTLTTNSIFTADAPIAITTAQAASNGIYTSTGTLDAAQTAVVAGDVIIFEITQVGTTFTGNNFVGQVKID